MAAIDILERLRPGYRPPMELVEHQPARELVASVDILRVDYLGRTVVAVPAGRPPHSQLKLTAQERKSLVPPPEPKPGGYMNPGHGGFTPEGVVVGDRGASE